MLILDDLAYQYRSRGTAIEVEFNTVADLMTWSRFENGLNDYRYQHTRPGRSSCRMRMGTILSAIM